MLFKKDSLGILPPFKENEEQIIHNISQQEEFQSDETGYSQFSSHSVHENNILPRLLQIILFQIK